MRENIPLLEKSRDGAIGREEPLGGARGLAALPVAVVLPRGLVGIVKLSEGLAPSAGLHNRACQFPSTRLLKRVGFCHKDHSKVTDRDGLRVAGRDSDGGPPPECARR